MIFVKTNETNEVVMSHTNPMDPIEGLGKTEEELRAEGFVFEFLEDVPRTGKREGYRAVTYCDGEKFWFEYRELGAVDMQELLLKVEDVRRSNLKRKEELVQMKTKVEEVQTSALAINNGLADVIHKNQELEQKLLPVEQALVTTGTAMEEMNQHVANVSSEMMLVALETAKIPEMEAEVLQLSSVATNANEVANAVKGTTEEHETVIAWHSENIIEHDQKIEMTEMTMSESIMEMMMTQMTLSKQQAELLKQGKSLGEQVVIVGMTEQMMAETVMGMMLAEMELGATKEKLLSTTAEMVTTKKELQDTREQLTQTQAEMAELIMMILEGGMVQ